MSPWPPEGDPRARGRSPSRFPGPATPIWRERSSSGTTTSATRSSARARARPRSTSPQARVAKALLAEIGVSVAGASVEIGGADSEAGWEGGDGRGARRPRHARRRRRSRRERRPAGARLLRGEGGPARRAARSALMGIQAVKGVEIGDGFALARMRGSRGARRDRARSPSRDEPRGRARRGRHERVSPSSSAQAMKPLPTLMRPLRSVDLARGEPGEALVERSDVQAVEALAVVAEAAVAWELARAAREKFGGDALVDFVGAHAAYLERIAWPYERARPASRARRLHGRGEVDARARCSPSGFGRPFVSIDAVVEERAGATVAEIFETRGEGAFRELRGGGGARRPRTPAARGRRARWRRARLGAHASRARRARVHAPPRGRPRRGMGARRRQRSPARTRPRGVRRALSTSGRRSTRPRTRAHAISTERCSPRRGSASVRHAERPGRRRRRRRARRRARTGSAAAHAPGRGSKTLAEAERLWRCAADRPVVDARRGRRRHDDRPRRLRRRDVHARDRLGRGAVDAGRPGGRGDRRQGRRSTRRRGRTSSARSTGRQRPWSTPRLLETLPDEERRNGLAEVVKTGLLAGEAYWELETGEQVRRCAAFKAAVCLRDPYERGERAQLNLGHTFAHALEAASGYAVPHGRAVALGLLAALRLSGLDDDACVVAGGARADAGRGRPRPGLGGAPARQEGGRRTRFGSSSSIVPAEPRRDVRDRARARARGLDALIA